MNRNDITELHYIAAISNVPSILQLGILSHTRSKKIPHSSIAMQEIQELRKNKKIPNAGDLHDYVNLYFDAHNPMLSKVRKHNDDICVLQIDVNVLDLPGVIIADRNAASPVVSFSPVNSGLKALDRERIFAKWWLHPDDFYDERRHKLEKCAEVLVPDSVNPSYIIGAYVVNQRALSQFAQLKTQLPVDIKNDIFF